MYIPRSSCKLQLMSVRYVPPRAGWSNTHHLTTQSPRRSRVNSGGSDYMEDVDPKFAEAPPLPTQDLQQYHTVPRILAPGPHSKDPSPEASSTALPHANSYEDLPGARSPAESETSNFTSISQRGVNPNWRPGNGGEFSSLGPMRKQQNQQQQRRQDMLFAGNPDFELPGMGPPRGTRPGARGGYRGSMGSGPGRPLPASAVGGPDGRFPTEPPQGHNGMMREV